MKGHLYRILTVGAVFLVGVVILGINSRQLYDDTIQSGEQPFIALSEIGFGIVLGGALMLASYELLRNVSTASIIRIGRWILVAGGVGTAGVGIVILSQLVQAEINVQVLFVNIVGIGILTGIAVGYYDAVQKEQQRIIGRERDQFGALFTNVPTAVIAVTKRNGRVEAEMVNPAFEEVFGYTKSELDGHDVRDILRPADEEPEVIEGTSLTGLPGDSQGEWEEVYVTLKTEYGQREFIRISTPLHDLDYGPGEYAFYIDVTEQLQRKERIQVMSRALRHDLRNRLSVIQASAEMLTETKEDSEGVLADQIQTATDDLVSLSEQTRTIEKLVSQEYERQAINIKDTVSSVLIDVSETWPAAEISTEIPDNLYIRANSTLPIALEKVVTNAIEHNDTDSPQVRITVSDSSDSKFINIEIRDNGPGIPEEISAVITEDKSPDALHHSTGMGLWIANWITKKLGGELRIDPVEPRGTAVTLRLVRSEGPHQSE